MSLQFRFPATEFTEGFGEVTLDNIITITKTYSGNKQVQPIRHVEDNTLKPIYVPLGYNPISVSFSGYLNVTTTLSDFLSIYPDYCLFVNISSYTEMPVSTYWEVESLSVERLVGYNNIAKYSLSLVKQEHIGVR